jgi:thiol-disulfide isomerase/thioredoxin
MKNILLVIFFSMLFFTCSQPHYTMTEEEGGTKIVLGEFKRELFTKEPNFNWFTFHYDEYTPDSSVVGQLKEKLSGLHFVIILGTWCGDSKRETPKMIRVLDMAGISDRKIEYHGVDRTKRSVDGSTDHYNVTRVPTLIVLDGQTELGRITEYPRKTIELDLLDIAKKRK